MNKRIEVLEQTTQFRIERSNHPWCQVRVFAISRLVCFPWEKCRWVKTSTKCTRGNLSVDGLMTFSHVTCQCTRFDTENLCQLHNERIQVSLNSCIRSRKQNLWPYLGKPGLMKIALKCISTHFERVTMHCNDRQWFVTHYNVYHQTRAINSNVSEWFVNVVQCIGNVSKLFLNVKINA